MSHAWQLPEAKNKFSKLVERAQQEGPQMVTKHGKEAVIVLSVDDYKKITRSKENLVIFLQKSPRGDVEMDLSRNKGTFP